MTSQGWMTAVTVIAFLAGIVLGALAILTASAVWWRKQIFATGGISLCIVGVILVGLSIWQSVKVGFGKDGWSVEFSKGIAGDIKMKGDAITVDGRPASLPDGPTQIGFWTPSVRTKESKDIKPWEVVESDDRLNQFADKLIEAKIIEGYRRYEVTGAGRGSRKIGAWWVSTNSGKFRLADFVKAYDEFWKPGTDSTFMEVVPLRSSGYPPRTQ